MLAHPQSRERYESLCKRAPAQTISAQDVAITQRCQALLEAGRAKSGVLEPLLPLSTPVLLQMKTVVSHLLKPHELELYTLFACCLCTVGDN
jgi:hypothetical protein